MNPNGPPAALPGQLHRARSEEGCLVQRRHRVRHHCLHGHPGRVGGLGIRALPARSRYLHHRSRRPRGTTLLDPVKLPRRAQRPGRGPAGRHLLVPHLLDVPRGDQADGARPRLVGPDRRLHPWQPLGPDRRVPLPGLPRDGTAGPGESARPRPHPARLGVHASDAVGEHRRLQREPGAAVGRQGRRGRVAARCQADRRLPHRPAPPIDHCGLQPRTGVQQES